MSNPEILPSEGFGPEAFAQALGVSRETLALLEAYAGLLAASPHNLVSQASLAEVWHRHFYDSAQLDALIPSGAKTLVDLGSGAGFPGLVLAILRHGQIKITLFEATGKKAAFLKEVAAALGLDIVLRQQRIEDVPKQRFDVVTARAFAPLPQLLSYAQKFTGPNSICLFLKGQNHATELTQARQVWKMDLRKHPSKTHPLGVILEIRNLRYAAR